MSVALGCGLHGLTSEGISGEMLALCFLLLVCNYKHFVLFLVLAVAGGKLLLGKQKQVFSWI